MKHAAKAVNVASLMREISGEERCPPLSPRASFSIQRICPPWNRCATSESRQKGGLESGSAHHAGGRAATALQPRGRRPVPNARTARPPAAAGRRR